MYKCNILVYIYLNESFLFYFPEKATSQLLLEPDWDSTMQICDIIRQGDVQ